MLLWLVQLAPMQCQQCGAASCSTTNRKLWSLWCRHARTLVRFLLGCGSTSTTHYVLRPTFKELGQLEVARWHSLCALGTRPERPSCVEGLLKIPQTFCSLPRSVCHFETHHGHLEVDEMEGLIEYTGYLHAYWVLQITTHFDAPLPAEAELFVETDSGTEWRALVHQSWGVTGSFVYVEGWFSPLDGARPSFPGIVSLRTFRVCRTKKERLAAAWEKQFR